ncbi:nuclear transport factor 2 family protein [Cellulomonas sp. URHB0016]
MDDGSVTQGEVAALVDRVRAAAAAYVRGDMDRYLELVDHAPGYTLVPPFGGPPVRFEDRAEGVRAAAGYFTRGEATLESVETQAWGDTVVIAMVERQHGEVGGLPDQDWSVRVTEVYRRDGRGWVLVHRHADPIVRFVGLDGAAALARGPQDGDLV